MELGIRPLAQDERPETIADLVYGRIRDAIVDKILVPGAAVSVADLARTCRVSKTPVRETLLRLQEHGLVERDALSGRLRVTTPSQSRIAAAYEAREALELGAALHATARASDEELAATQRLATKSIQAADSGDAWIFRAGDRRFHTALAVASNSPRLALLVTNALLLTGAVRARRPGSQFLGEPRARAQRDSTSIRRTARRRCVSVAHSAHQACRRGRVERLCRHPAGPGGVGPSGWIAVNFRPDHRPVTNVAIGALGTIGRAVTKEIASRRLAGYRVAAVAARHEERAQNFLASVDAPNVPIVPLSELASYAELVLECAPPECFEQVAEPAVSAGKDLITLSVGALLDAWGLVEYAKTTGATIHVPTGALLGLDAVQAARQGTIESITMVTRKPPAALAGSRYVVEHGIDLAAITEPQVIFSGSVRAAIRQFPSNVNVAVALSLASNGPDATDMEILGDPRLTRNTHAIDVRSDSVRLHMEIENIPSENPATGLLTANSTIALLRKMRSTLRVGT